jgi:drug/metabolite transporter, DME family
VSDAQPRSTGALLVLAGAVLWGTTGTAQALGVGALPGVVPPPVVGAARIAVGGLGLLLVAALSRSLPGRALVSRRGVVVPLLAGAAAIALYQATFFAAVSRTGVAIGTVVAIGSAPAFTGLFGWAVRRERPERGWAAATALAVAGCVLLLAPQGGVGVDPVGVALALVAGSCFGVGTVSMKSLLEAGLAPTAVMALVFGGGAVLLSPVLLAADLSWVARPAGAAMVLFLGLGATTLAYVLFANGLRRVRSSSAATLALAEPLTAALLGIVLIGERPGLLGWLGGALVAGGLVVLAWRPARG